MLSFEENIKKSFNNYEEEINSKEEINEESHDIFYYYI